MSDYENNIGNELQDQEPRTDISSFEAHQDDGYHQDHEIPLAQDHDDFTRPSDVIDEEDLHSLIENETGISHTEHEEFNLSQFDDEMVDEQGSVGNPAPEEASQAMHSDQATDESSSPDAEDANENLPKPRSPYPPSLAYMMIAGAGALIGKAFTSIRELSQPALTTKEAGIQDVVSNAEDHANSWKRAQLDSAIEGINQLDQSRKDSFDRLINTDFFLKSQSLKTAIENNDVEEINRLTPIVSQAFANQETTQALADFRFLNSSIKSQIETINTELDVANAGETQINQFADAVSSIDIDNKRFDKTLDTIEDGKLGLDIRSSLSELKLSLSSLFMRGKSPSIG